MLQVWLLSGKEGPFPGLEKAAYLSSPHMAGRERERERQTDRQRDGES